MSRITQALVWLSRIHRCQGFGIQSPTDYSFVRDVVNEHRPYYAYSEVGQGDRWLRRKLGRLYLRLANYVQPNIIIDLAGYADYLHAGCRKASICQSASHTNGSLLVIARPDDVHHDLLACCNPKTMLVVEGIAKHRQQWKTVMQWPAVSVTFDLYYCGIATFNPKRAKENHIVNF